MSLKAVVNNPEPDEPAPTTARMPVDIRSAALTVLAGLAIVLTLQYAQAMVIPIVLGVLISYALEPIVAWLARRRIPRAVGAAVVLLALVGGTGWLLYGLRSQASAIIEQLPQAATRLRRMVENDRPTAATAIQQVQKAASELEKAANAAAPPPAASGVQRVQVEAPSINIGDYVMWGSIGIVAAIGQLVLILFLVYFLLASGDLYRRKLVKIVGPTLTDKKLTVQILQEIDRQIEMFLLVQVFTSTVVAVATWAAFRALGVEQAAVWGVMAGLFNSIPYFGPVIVTGGTSVVAFLQFGDLRMAAIVGGVSLLITSLEGFLLTPWLTSRAARMNAVAVFVGLLFWGWVWNVWGMLLAVPLLMVIKAVCDHIEDFQGIGELLGD
ncbi:MAG: family transporter [Acidobacteria bacterium]|nr:family transporter [Acidobacteriota bacterium]